MNPRSLQNPSSLKLTGLILLCSLMLLLVDCRASSRRPEDSFPRLEPSDETQFGERELSGLLEYDPIDEASGIAASRMNPGVIWAHNDSGDAPRLFAFDTAGKHLGVFDILGAKARDWEDMAIGPGPQSGRRYLYVADSGDNKAKRDIKTIYRIPEPVVQPDQKPIESALSGVEAIRFRYPDGRRDAETLIVDPKTGDLIIISKREKQVRIYAARAPQSTSEVITLERVGTLPLHNVVGGDISPSGREILLKTYNAVYYWQRLPGRPIWEALALQSIVLPYFPEPQGEAITWTADEMGYYTLSEERGNIPAYLYYYPRLKN
jgi:hypothetical protein